MLNGAYENLVEALAAFSNAREHGTFSEEDGERVYSAEALAEYGRLLADATGTLLDELAQPTNRQALALARLMRDRPGAQVVVHQNVFDLPDDFWLAVIGLDGFQCGIAPDGSVSS